MNARKRRAGEPRETEQPVVQILSRIAAILLRLGLDAPAAQRHLRTAFVFAASDRARASDVRPTQSQIAALAGISRLEVRTILARKFTRAAQADARRLTRVDQLVSGWRTDPNFLDERGRPKPLQLKGGQGAFDHLARKYGRDVTSNTLRDELVRQGMASLKKGKLVLTRPSNHVRSDAAAAQADLRFLASQLEGIDFQLGRRAYAIRRVMLTTPDKKSVHMIKTIAVQRLETVLNSLTEMSTEANGPGQRRNRRSRRLLITATVATEAEAKSS